jgi:pyrroline-5-carboxylate reductase
MNDSKIGFIGTGTITEAVIKGLTSSPDVPSEIWVSPRNACIASQLAHAYPLVHVACGNQEVADRCDVICLAVRPQVAEDVLGSIRFSGRHHVISFIAAYGIGKLQDLVAPAKKLVRAAPLPTVAEQLCSTIVFPPDEIARRLFIKLGGAIEVASEEAFNVLFSATATMGSFFALLENQARWLERNGLSYPDAREYLASLYFGLASVAREKNGDFAVLSKEFTTTGGLNQQVLDALNSTRVFDAFDQAFDQVLQRLGGAPASAK